MTLGVSSKSNMSDDSSSDNEVVSAGLPEDFSVPTIDSDEKNEYGSTQEQLNNDKIYAAGGVIYRQNQLNESAKLAKVEQCKKENIRGNILKVANFEKGSDYRKADYLTIMGSILSGIFALAFFFSFIWSLLPADNPEVGANIKNKYSIFNITIDFFYSTLSCVVTAYAKYKFNFEYQDKIKSIGSRNRYENSSLILRIWLLVIYGVATLVRMGGKTYTNFTVYYYDDSATFEDKYNLFYISVVLGALGSLAPMRDFMRMIFPADVELNEATECESVDLLKNIKKTSIPKSVNLPLDFFNLLIDFVNGIFDCGFISSQLIENLAYSGSKKIKNFSYVSMGFGFFIGVLMSIAQTYAHWKFHQHHHDTANSLSHNNSAKELHRFQKIILFFDLSGHTLDNASKLINMLRIVLYAKINFSNASNAKIAIYYAGAMLLALPAALAEVRACRTTMMVFNPDSPDILFGQPNDKSRSLLSEDIMSYCC